NSKYGYFYNQNARFGRKSVMSHFDYMRKFYQSTQHRKIYCTLKSLQADLDEWLEYYNNG
ncbi:MAG: hypothetical protein ABW100_09120, partial [Candidatus Thiodiazotropha sp. 6PLUC3]